MLLHVQVIFLVVWAGAGCVVPVDARPSQSKMRAMFSAFVMALFNEKKRRMRSNHSDGIHSVVLSYEKTAEEDQNHANRFKFRAAL